VAKQLEWDVLKGSNLDRTLVRPPHIVNGESTAKVSADEKNLSRTKGLLTMQILWGIVIVALSLLCWVT
jgi:hypothetical protein